jgi:hypothetical protein
MKQTRPNEVALLSKEFSQILKTELSAEEMTEVVRINSLPAYSDACASHDFCDANMVMNEAFEKVMQREFDFDSDCDTDLFNGAWSLAKTNNFYI